MSIKRFLTKLWFTIRLPEYRILSRSGYFDATYYLQNNKDVAKLGTDPLGHYVTSGFREPRHPSLLFDIFFYMDQLEQFDRQTDNPPLHYYHHGWKKGKKPNLVFDPEFYVAVNPQINFDKIEPFTHFIKTWHLRENAFTCPYFDASYYNKRYQKAETKANNPLGDFLTSGLRENRQPSVFFDPEFYLDNTPILKETGLEPLKHYYDFGIQELKTPTPVFDPVFYQKEYALPEGIDLFAHYFQFGGPADHKPCNWFDPKFYRQNYLESTNDDRLPLYHYLERGVREAHYPNREISELPSKPLISVVVPVYNVDPSYLKNCIRSVLYQSYPHWELCLADDCSTSETVRPLLRKWAEKDSRIKVCFLEKNQGISGATNAAAELATGEFIGFLDNDDELVPDCLFKVAKTIYEQSADLLYSDEDLIGEDGKQLSVFSKPAFNSELLLTHNYITHFVVSKRELFDEVGGFKTEYNGAQDYDLFLKLSEKAKNIVHINEILYHWRASESSTSINHNQKYYANEAGKKALETTLKRRNISAQVHFTDWKYFYRVKHNIEQDHSVTIAVYWDNQEEDLAQWLKTLVDNSGFQAITIALYFSDEHQVEKIQAFEKESGLQVTCHSISASTPLAKVYNLAIENAGSDLIAFVSSDVLFEKSGWLASLVEFCQQEDVGMVGGRLHCNTSNLDEVTPVADCSNSSAFYYSRYLTEKSILMNGLNCVQQTMSVAWELCLGRVSTLQEIGGFNESEFPNLFAIHDLCYRLLKNGMKNIYTPYSVANWQGNSDRFNVEKHEQLWLQEKTVFQSQYRNELHKGDPYFSKRTLLQSGVLEDTYMEWLINQ